MDSSTYLSSIGGEITIQPGLNNWKRSSTNQNAKLEPHPFSVSTTMIQVSGAYFQNILELMMLGIVTLDIQFDPIELIIGNWTGTNKNDEPLSALFSHHLQAFTWTMIFNLVRLIPSPNALLTN
jgi:hypothetical protein